MTGRPLRLAVLATLLFLPALPASAPAQTIISTVAGGGPDHMPATAADLHQPWGVAIDASGNYFIISNARVFRVDTTGLLTVVAGTGLAGFSGDGGAATSASFYYPAGVAVDGFGNLFIADEGNGRIRRVDAATGVITTVAGNGTSDGFTGDGGPGTSASLWTPTGVAVDGSGNLIHRG